MDEEQKRQLAEGRAQLDNAIVSAQAGDEPAAAAPKAAPVAVGGGGGMDASAVTKLIEKKLSATEAKLMDKLNAIATTLAALTPPAS